jgi:hypothetical protein
MAWSGFALAVLAVIAVPTVLKMAGDGATIAVKPDDTISRTIVVTPSSPAKKKDAQSCIDANEKAGKSRATGEVAERPGEAPTENNDPCGPKKPAAAGKPERPASAGSN